MNVVVNSPPQRVGSAASQAGRAPVQPFAGYRLLGSIGATPDGAVLPIPITPSATQLFAPRGLCWFAADGPLWVCDSGHHRVPGWRDGAPDDGAADWEVAP